MDQKTSDTFYRILKIIGYSEDKENYINDFISSCEQKAILNLIDSLPKDKKISIKKSLQDNPDKLLEVVKQFFTREQLSQAIMQVTEDAFSKYLQRIYPTLQSNQREQLETFLSSIPPVNLRIVQ